MKLLVRAGGFFSFFVANIALASDVNRTLSIALNVGVVILLVSVGVRAARSAKRGAR